MCIRDRGQHTAADQVPRLAVGPVPLPVEFDPVCLDRGHPGQPADLLRRRVVEVDQSAVVELPWQAGPPDAGLPRGRRVRRREVPGQLPPAPRGPGVPAEQGQGDAVHGARQPEHDPGHDGDALGGGRVVRVVRGRVELEPEDDPRHRGEIRGGDDVVLPPVALHRHVEEISETGHSAGEQGGRGRDDRLRPARPAPGRLRDRRGEKRGKRNRVGRRWRLHLAAQDPPVHVLHPLAGLGADLVQEVLAGVAEHCQRLGLPPVPVQRHHQVRPQPLPQRELGGQPGQLGHQPGILVALGQSQAGPALPGAGPFLGQPLPGGVEDRPGQAAERVPVPEGERVAQDRDGRVGPGGRGPEHLGVHRVRPDVQQVTAAGQDEPFPAEDATQPGDVLLDHVRAVLRRVVGPHRVDDPVGRHRLAGLQQEDGEHGALFGRPQVDALGPGEGAQGAEELEPQLRLHPGSPPIDLRFP